MPTWRLSALLYFQHTLAQAVGGRVHQTLGALFYQETGQRHGRVDGQFEADVGFVAVRRQRVAPLLRPLLFRAHQRPAHTVVMNGVIEYLLVADTDDLDDLTRFRRTSLVVALEHFDFLM